MEKSKKKKLLKVMKEKWVLCLGTALFLIAGIVALLVGFALTGWSIVDWIKSPYATTCFIILACGGLTLLATIIAYKRMHLGD